MRLHISVDDNLVAELDDLVGKRMRSSYIESVLKKALEDRRRWSDIASAIGTISSSGHEWDADPAAWVQHQRSSDERRVG